MGIKAPRLGLEPRVPFGSRLTVGCIYHSTNEEFKMEPAVGFEPTTDGLSESSENLTTHKTVALPLSYAGKWWVVQDSNLRSPKAGDLQSPVIAAIRTTLKLVPRAGLEPARSNEQRILSPLCLPFHHLGL